MLTGPLIRKVILDLALKNAAFITSNLIDADGKLIRIYKKGAAQSEWKHCFFR
jgi:hypothetical protein